MNDDETKEEFEPDDRAWFHEQMRTGL